MEEGESSLLQVHRARPSLRIQVVSVQVVEVKVFENFVCVGSGGDRCATSTDRACIEHASGRGIKII